MTLKQTFLLPGPVSVHRVMGGIAGYLLIGVTWAFGYKLLLEMIPDAIHFQTPLAVGVSTGEPGRLIYFSFETLTTVSYGDAYPVHRVARSLTTAEALIGQLYPAILIATLVGMVLQARFNATLKANDHWAHEPCFFSVRNSTFSKCDLPWRQFASCQLRSVCLDAPFQRREPLHFGRDWRPASGICASLAAQIPSLAQCFSSLR